jgi:DNA ligase-1
MTSDEIFAAIEHIASVPGKNDKIALVTKHCADPEFVRVLKATYNPLITYGVRKFLLPHVSSDGQFDDSTWHILTMLADRTLTGNAALEAIRDEMQRLTTMSATLFKRIILKDMRAGFDAETCNKAVKGMVPAFPYMRCSLPKHVKLDEFFADGCTVQEKADGMYMNLDIALGGEVRLSSRQGTEYPMGAFSEFEAAASATLTHGTQTHGEMLVLRDGKILPREDGNGVLNHVAAGGDFAENERPLFLAWDQIPLSAVVPKGKYNVPYKQRLADLLQQIKGSLIKGSPGRFFQLIETKVVKNMDEAMAFYRKKLAEGKEGAIVKKLTAIWRDGTSREQIKLKLEVCVELKVTGYNGGTGKYEGMLGSLVCESHCGELQVDVSGRGDDMRKNFAIEDWDGAIVTVKANAIMPPGDSNPRHSLFLPIFVERRTDKGVADTLAQIKAQFEAAVQA